MAQFQTTPVSQLADSYDAVIVGSGGTGLAAAIQAHELGMNVAVLEKEEQLGGNTNRASSGMNAAETNVQLKHGIIDNINDFYRETYKDGGKLNDKDIGALHAELTDPRFNDEFWDSEIHAMLDMGKKAEQQALAKYGLDYVTDTYLPEKLSQLGLL